MLIETNKLALKMEAKALSKATPVNLASHTYWNLGGHNSSNILSHALQVYGSQITPVDDELIPTDKIVAVEGTPYDFKQSHEIRSMFNELPNGYDINYVLDDLKSGHLKKAVVVWDNISGRKLEPWTTALGLQFYTSNKLGNVKGNGGFTYTNHAAICLETRGFSDSINHPNFSSQTLNLGEIYEHIMVYRFTANKEKGMEIMCSGTGRYEFKLISDV